MEDVQSLLDIDILLISLKRLLGREVKHGWERQSF